MRSFRKSSLLGEDELFKEGLEVGPVPDLLKDFGRQRGVNVSQVQVLQIERVQAGALKMSIQIIVN